MKKIDSHINCLQRMVCVSLLTLTFAGAYAQSRPVAPAVGAAPAQAQAQVAAKPPEVQWEYLVVSYGKTIFGAPEKTLAYRSIGLSATAQEANEVQRSLDVLGRFGWEVITIVGTIGGDQQIVFKRRYDRARSVNEASEILKGREVFLRDLLDIMERESRIRDEAAAAAEAERNRPRLIELDAVDAAQMRARLSAERKAALEAAIAGTPWGSRATIKVRPEGTSTYIDAVLDGTPDFLKNGNTYRKSEVASWVKSNLLSALQTTATSLGGYLDINVTTNINFNGVVTRVDQQRSSYSSYLRRWD
jgi:hypothetical protein